MSSRLSQQRCLIPDTQHLGGEVKGKGEKEMENGRQGLSLNVHYSKTVSFHIPQKGKKRKPQTKQPQANQPP